MACCRPSLPLVLVLPLLLQLLLLLLLLLPLFGSGAFGRPKGVGRCVASFRLLLRLLIVRRCSLALCSSGDSRASSRVAQRPAPLCDRSPAKSNSVARVLRPHPHSFGRSREFSPSGTERSVAAICAFADQICLMIRVQRRRTEEREEEEEKEEENEEAWTMFRERKTLTA